MSVFGIGWWAWSDGESTESAARIGASASPSVPADPRATIPARESPGDAKGTPAPQPAPPPLLETPAAGEPRSIEPEPEPNPEPEPEPEPVDAAEPDEAPRSAKRASRKELAAQRATKAKELLEEAGRAALAGRDEEALDLVERSLRLDKSTSGYAKLAMLACRLSDPKRAAAAHAKLRGRTRTDVRTACASRGIELPP